MDTPELSVIVPIFNEEKILPELYNRLSNSANDVSGAYELIFVNDGSSDNSIHLLKMFSQKNPRVKYLDFSRNFGHQVAITAGIDAVKGNTVVIIDGDLQDPPELIPELYQKLKEGYHVVYATRSRREGESFFKKFTARVFYRLLAGIISFEIPLDTGDFRIMDRQVTDYLKKMPEKNKFLRGQIAWLGFRQTHLDYVRDARKSGTTGFSIPRMLRFALDGITGFSDFPLRVATFSGFAVSFIAFLIILYALYSKFVLHRVITGWTSLIISTMFIGGIQLLTIGIIGEYISRIMTNVRNRPLYIISETNIEDAAPDEKKLRAMAAEE